MNQKFYIHKLRLRLYLKVVVILFIVIEVIYFICVNDHSDNFSTPYQVSSLKNGDTTKKVDVAEPLLTSSEEQRLRVLFPRNTYEKSSISVLHHLKQNKHYNEFDRRLLPAFWLHLINENLENEKSTSDFKLPFNWDMLNNIAARIPQEPYFKEVIKQKITCEKFRDLAPDGLPNSFLAEFCEDFDYKNPNFVNDYNLPIKIVRKVDQYLTDVHWRRIYGMMHMITALEIPSHVVFLGGIKGVNSLMIPLVNVSNGENDLTKLKPFKEASLNSYFDTLTDNYIKARLEKEPGNTLDNILTNGLSVYSELNKLNELISVPDTLEVNPTFKPITPTIIGSGISLDPPLDPLLLDKKEFKWFLPQEVEKLKSEIRKAKKEHSTDQLEHLLKWGEFVLKNEETQPWYYGIPSLRDKQIDHYDWRFFHDITFEDDKELHLTVLHRLARTWFKICQEFQIPSWLNHGSLIGWYWNGGSMPYDGDLDLQMPIQSLHRLAKFMNNTLIYDFSDDLRYVNDELKIDNRAELGIRSYLFDVDPLYLDRNGINNGDNNIDARLIDTETGLYIDLTALADFHSETQYDLKIQKKYLQITGWTHGRTIMPTNIDQFYDENGSFQNDGDKSITLMEKLNRDIDLVLKEGKSNSLDVSSPTRNLFQDFVHCKHFHTYDLNELFPLVPTLFENTISYLPSNWLRNLLIDYGSASPITDDYYHKNKFWPSAQMWIDYEDCPYWDEKSGKPLEGETEEQIILKCMDTNELVDKEIRANHYYGLQHQLYKSKLTVGNRSVVKYNYKDDLYPILKKGKLDHPLKSEPFVNRYLY